MSRGLTPDPPDPRPNLMQGWGKALLGAGIAAVLTGATLIEVDSVGRIGRAGFATGCAGVAVMAGGMWVLGISRPQHEPDEFLQRDPGVPPRNSKRARLTLSFSRSF